MPHNFEVLNGISTMKEIHMIKRTVKKNNILNCHKLYKCISLLKAKIESKCGWKHEIEVNDRVHIP